MSTNPTFWTTVAQHWEIARQLRTLKIQYDPDKCIGTWQCYEVCPVGCWTPRREDRIVVYNPEGCVACGACVLQCPVGAVELKVESRKIGDDKEVLVFPNGDDG